jgi:predicted NAD/FAD-binding protein
MRFDKVIIATHSDQALGMLGYPSYAEREVLGAIAYQPNDVVLHTDTSLMPRNERAWASWNYHIGEESSARATVTYDMNRLQGLSAPEPFLVTLNATERIDPSKIVRRLTYDHPVFDEAAVLAQARHGEINGHRNTYFCGAYWGNGFHEDGVNSALKVGAAFGRSL